MAINYAALKTELQSDPTSLGLAALLSAGNHDAVAAKLNEVNANIDVQRSTVASDEIIEAMDATEFAALAQANLLRLLILLQKETFVISRANTRALIAGVFPVGGPTRTRLAALLTRKGSRAEQLFNSSTVITAADIARALAT